MTADASSLYSAGTAKLERGDVGEAVALLLAAKRIDPRAPDIRRNLAIAERTVLAARGETPPPMPGGPALALSAAEGWWLAALLLALGAVAGIAAIWDGARGSRVGSGGRKRPRAWKWAAAAAVSAGVLVAGWLSAGAVFERRHPESVVVVASVEARRGVDEAPRSPILLRAGERVRTGQRHGDDVEVLLGGSPIGWVPRAALWNVADAPRYTGGLRPK
jgi:hypothetical protein